MRFAMLCRLPAVAVVAALLSASPGSAADEKHGDKGAGGAVMFVKDGDRFRPATEAEVRAAADVGSGAHGEKGGLDFTGIKRYDLGIYTLIVFGLLVFILAKVAWPKIREGLEKREAAIRGARDEAKQDRADAEARLAEAKKRLDATAAQVKGMLDEARRDADALRAGEREAGARDAAAERERAKREIDAARDAALKDIYEQAVKLAALMSEKALRRTVSAEDHRRLLDESLNELRDAAHKA